MAGQRMQIIDAEFKVVRPARAPAGRAVPPPLPRRGGPVRQALGALARRTTSFAVMELVLGLGVTLACAAVMFVLHLVGLIP